jgi:PIN domain nuclease of toxin-antitoxin system
MIHLDTHALVWYLNAHRAVGRRVRVLLERALKRDELAVSAVVFWEVAMLVHRGRLAVEGSVEQFRSRVLQLGIIEAPLDGAIALRAAQMSGVLADPADCMIAATAASADARLVTADQRLLECVLVKALDVHR